MPILFALIVSFHTYYGQNATRIGVYQKLSQCREQGKVMTDDHHPGAAFFCIPVNG